MRPILALFILVVLFIIELLYFKIADHFNIIDKPNHRSSHTEITIRGGGIVFSIGAFIFFVLFGFQYQWFLTGLFLISAISFLDDVITVSNKIRLCIHLISVILLLIDLNLPLFPWYGIILIVLFIIATINAYNFMDGINGITGSYSIITILTLIYINIRIISFAAPELLICVLLSLVVFNFFNFRAKAKCFAGDVGSVSIAFILIFLIASLILKTQNIAYISLLLLYGLDTASTIFFRILRKENIFIAHRSHFYQFLANQKKWPHLWVDVLYLFLQLLINLVLVFYIKDSSSVFLAFIAIAVILFIITRILIEGKKVLILSNDTAND